MANSRRTIYILYNADSTIMGKLQYGYRKVQRSNSSQPPCAACDITHGGFSLSENAGWKDAKVQIERDTGASVVQLHRDEVGQQMKSWIESSHLKYPAVILGKKTDERPDEEVFELMLGRDELGECKGDANTLAQRIKEQKAIQQQASL